MDKKVLYCASTARHLLHFHLPYIHYFKEKGWQVDVAVGGKDVIPWVDNVFVFPFEKRLLSVKNLHTVYSLKHLLEKNKYDMVSVHTTLAGALVRLAVMLSGKQDTKIVYTSHGYFFNGKEQLRKRPYLWIERLLAPVTDSLMVMNRLDYQLALQYKLGKEIVMIPGMGVDLTKYRVTSDESKKNLKVQKGFAPNDFLIVYAAEMSKRKNQGELIQAFAKALAHEPRLKLLLAGDGALKEHYQKQAIKYGLSQSVFFLGFVDDMVSVYEMCDLAVSTSRSEGLPFNVMEAMACGLPVVASRIKGHQDLLEDNHSLFELGKVNDLAGLLVMIIKDANLRKEIGIENRTRVQSYGLSRVKPQVIQGLGIVEGIKQ